MEEGAAESFSRKKTDDRKQVKVRGGTGGDGAECRVRGER